MAWDAAADFMEAADENLTVLSGSVSRTGNAPARKQHQQNIDHLHREAQGYTGHMQAANTLVGRVYIRRENSDHQQCHAHSRSFCCSRKQQSQRSGELQDTCEHNPHTGMRKDRWNDGVRCGSRKVADRGHSQWNCRNDSQQPLCTAELLESSSREGEECNQNENQQGSRNEVARKNSSDS
jgi:hypothetical protein